MTEMDPADRDIIVTALSAAQPRAADGFNQYFGLLGGPLKAFAKQGWMYYGGRVHLHSAGVVGNGSDQYVVVLMTSQATSTDAARGNVSRIAAAIPGGMPASAEITR